MKRIISIGIFLFSFFYIGVAIAQVDVGRATRETDALGRAAREREEQMLGPPKRQEAPQIKIEPAPIGPEEKKFYIKTIELQGCESFPPEDFNPIIEKYLNREVALSELETLSKEIEREYLRRGIIAAVFVPPQDIKNDTAVLQVVEARMGDLMIQDSKYFSKIRLHYYWQIARGEILRYDKISRSIQYMNKNPDREVKAALRAGKKPGTTDVVLTPKTRFPLHLGASFDNEGAESTGKSRTGISGQDNNFLGLDDIFLAGSTFGRNFLGTYFYHNIPISNFGTSFVYGYSKSSSAPTKEFDVYDIRSEANNANVSLRQDIYKKDEYLGEVYLGFDAKDKVTHQADIGVANKDRLRIFSLGSKFTLRGLTSTTFINPEVYQGVRAFGASDDDNPLASRGAKPTFTIFDLSVNYRKVLPLNFQGNVKLKGQFATRKLTPQEEFSLGGISSVRGYPPDDFLADQAFLTNLELLFPTKFIPAEWRIPYDKNSLREAVSPLIFVDYGWGERRGAAQTEKFTKNYLSAGPGIRIRVFDQALLRFEWGFQIGDNRPITEAGHSRFHFSVDFQDKLPEEVERIKQVMEEQNIKNWSWQLVNDELNLPESPIRNRFLNYIYSAQMYYMQGKLDKSKEIYERIDQMGKSLYQQAEDYVRSCMLKEKELQNSYNLALTSSKEGNLGQAKQLLEKILKEAKVEPLIFEF